ncbi:MAG: nuclear transport factor 2 family protein [Alphaproteobacteria bacterium]|nr:nuclear transport factor 2 family protein [Alphaproteobacteria bacterium]
MSDQSDRRAIRERLEAYADAVFRRDATAWAANWVDDGEWDLAGTKVRGRDQIVAVWNGAMAQFSFVGFFVQLGEVQISGDSATARSYTTEYLTQTDGQRRRVIGTYEDRLVRRGDTWLFAGRSYRILNDTEEKL